MSKLQIEDTAISNTTMKLQLEIAKEIENNLGKQLAYYSLESFIGYSRIQYNYANDLDLIR